MAYQANHAAFRAEDVNEDDSLPFLSSAAAPALGALDALSTRVILLARVEAARSVPAKGLARLWHWFLGEEEAPRPLANARLDMLRRFSTLVWLGDGQSEALAQTLMGKGHYDAMQIEMARMLSRA